MLNCYRVVMEDLKAHHCEPISQRFATLEEAESYYEFMRPLVSKASGVNVFVSLYQSEPDGCEVVVADFLQEI